MPYIKRSSYKAPLLLLNKHVQTVYPHFWRKTEVRYSRERILTPDKDFLDLDWVKTGSRKLAIISHGLEGSSHSSYVQGMASALAANGWDALAWNFRSCSGEPNRLPIWYHGGQSDDLRCVFSHALFKKDYNQIAMVGFSLGGNLTLKFLGEHGKSLHALVNRAVVFSAPCCLAAAAEELSKFKNRYYARHFLFKLKNKVLSKIEMLPDEIRNVDMRQVNTFKDFDDRFTGPIHGFKNAQDYWDQCSSRRFLKHIAVPTLIINAKDDPFLGDGCYPVEEAHANTALFLETPRRGGHVGFVSLNHNGCYWSERRALEFFAQQLDVPEPEFEDDEEGIQISVSMGGAK